MRLVWSGGCGGEGAAVGEGDGDGPGMSVHGCVDVVVVDGGVTGPAEQGQVVGACWPALFAGHEVVGVGVLGRGAAAGHAAAPVDGAKTLTRSKAARWTKRARSMRSGAVRFCVTLSLVAL